jgi:DNA-3-methyladenine glycosylase
MNLQIKRVYEQPSLSDGYRVLVDRLWPRGVSKEAAKLDEWCKDVAPSNELRQWFGHQPERFEEFSKRYRAELADNPAIQELKDLIKNKSTVTLVYSAHDETHNQAVVLQGVLSKSE